VVHTVLTLTYLSPRLILSPNWPKWASTWHTWPRSTIGCAQNAFHASGTFWHKQCTYLAPRSTLSLNGPKWASTWHTLHKGSIGCNQSDFHSRGTFGVNRASFLHRYQNFLQIDRKELPLDPRHLGVQQGVSKMISEAMVCLTQTMHLSCAEINTIGLFGRNWFVPSGVHKAISKPRVHLAQSVHLSCVKINTISK
jgi:hypothetical protein